MNIKLKYFSWLLCLLFVVVLYSCAPSDATGISKTYGFWGGVFHGFIFGFALLGKILSYLLHAINDNWGNWNIGLWADNNSGASYWVGYFVGAFLCSITLRTVSHK